MPTGTVLLSPIDCPKNASVQVYLPKSRMIRQELMSTDKDDDHLSKGYDCALRPP